MRAPAVRRCNCQPRQEERHEQHPTHRPSHSDPQLRETDDGTTVCTIGLAIPRRKRDGVDQGAVFVDVVTFSGQAKAVADHLRKGRQVAVIGRLEFSRWEDSEGSRHSKHEVVGEHVEFLS
jgi:single-strand DNA-binding protein